MAGAAFLRVMQQAIRVTTGTQDFTIAGVGTPKGAIFILSRCDDDEVNFDGAGMGIGFSDGTNNACVAAASADNVADSDTAREWAFNDCIHLTDYAAGSAVVVGRAATLITDGVQINFTTVDGIGHILTVILICGSDASCKVGKFNKADSTGTPNTTLDVTGHGFDPNLVFFGGMLAITGLVETGSAVSTSGSLALGVGCLNGSSAVRTMLASWAHRDTRPTSLPASYSDLGTQGQIYTGFVGVASGALTKIGTLNLDAFITDGFRVKDVPGGDPPPIVYCAIRLDGVPLDIVEHDSLDSDSGDIPTTITATKPGSVFVISTTADALGDKTDSQSTGLGYGFADQFGQASEAFWDEDAAATMNTGSVSSSNKVILNPSNSGGTGLSAVASFTTTEVSFTWNTSYTSSRKQLVVVIQRPTFSATAALTGPHPDSDSTAKQVFSATAALTGPHPDADATAKLAFVVNADLVGPHADADATARLVFSASAALVGPHPDSDSVALLVYTATAALTGPSGDVDADADLAFVATAALVGPSADADADADQVFIATAALLGPSADADADADLVFRATADLVGPSAKADATAANGFEATADLFGPHPTAAAQGLLIFRCSADLVGPHAFATGSDSPPIGCVHDMTASHDLEASLTAEHDAVADLSGSYDLVADLRGANC